MHIFGPELTFVHHQWTMVLVFITLLNYDYDSPVSLCTTSSCFILIMPRIEFEILKPFTIQRALGGM